MKMFNYVAGLTVFCLLKTTYNLVFGQVQSLGGSHYHEMLVASYSLASIAMIVLVAASNLVWLLVRTKNTPPEKDWPLIRSGFIKLSGALLIFVPLIIFLPINGKSLPGWKFWVVGFFVIGMSILLKDGSREDQEAGDLNHQNAGLA